MKIHILANLKEGPSGGGNHFLINLRSELHKLSVYAEHIKDSDVVLINSHNSISDFPNIGRLVEGKAVVHRMDGLQKIYNHKNDERQDLAISSNKLAHYTIFQSEWSETEYRKVARFISPSTIIYNAASPEFFVDGEKKLNNHIRLVTSCWSTNKNKGFDALSYIDGLLPRHPKVKFSFIGNSPINFNNIEVYKVSDRAGVSKILRSSDIYFHPSKFEACSNSLLEGLACGLPSVYVDSGSNREVVCGGGLSFVSKETVFKHAISIADNYALYQSEVPIRSMGEVAKMYKNTCEKALNIYRGFFTINSAMKNAFSQNNVFN